MMNEARPPVPLESLLAERAWVEALARTLVRDDATAGDVTQETWLAALRAPPRESSALRGWLSRVVRHTASKSRRAASRRARWESGVPAPTAPPSPEETVA